MEAFLFTDDRFEIVDGYDIIKCKKPWPKIINHPVIKTEYEEDDYVALNGGLYVIPYEELTDWVGVEFNTKLLVVSVESEHILDSDRTWWLVDQCTILREATEKDWTFFKKQLHQNAYAYYDYEKWRNAGPDDAVRSTICALGNSHVAVQYALDIDKGPHDDTRNTACKNASSAYRYAKEIDKCPRDDTRKAACGTDYVYAYFYACYVDKGPHDSTREAVCNDSRYAFKYAKNIDKKFHPQTYEAVKSGNKDRFKLYVELFGDGN